VVVTRTGSVVNFYTDGVHDGTETLSGSLGGNSVPVLLGSAYNSGTHNQFCNGYLDEIKIYSFGLTADQVKLLYNQGSAAVWGATSTDSSGNASWSSANEYCPPGQGSTCTGPVAEWKFDENTGTSTVYDTSGNELAGTMNGSMTEDDWVVGKQGSALDFDGSDDLINAGTGNPIDNLGPLTVSAWIYPRNTTCSGGQECGIIITKLGGNSCVGTGSQGWVLNFLGTNGKLNFCASNGSTNDTYKYSALATINSNEWYHVTATWDGSTNASGIHLYVNGIEVSYGGSVSNMTGSQDDSSVDLKIGAWSALASGDFDGIIDQVKLYDYVRTPAQIAWDYNRGGPVGWWKFDECEGTTAHDSSGNGNNGTIYPQTGNSAGTCGGTPGDMWADGETGKRNASLAFDSTDDYAKVSHDSSLVFTDGSNDRPFSISSWIKPSDTGIDYIFAKRDGNSEYYLFFDNGNIRLNTFDSSVCYTELSNPLTDFINKWIHVVATYDGRGGNYANRGMNLYVNGVKQERSFQSECINYIAMNTYTNDIAIGASNATPTGNYLGGQLDDLRVYNYELNSQQVKDIYNSGTLFFGPNTGSP
jgi:hypothetical protein